MPPSPRRRQCLRPEVKRSPCFTRSLDRLRAVSEHHAVQMHGGRCLRSPCVVNHQERWQNGQASALVEPMLLVTVTVTLIVKLPSVPHTFEQVGPVQLLLKPPDHAYVIGVEEVTLTLQ